MRFDQLVRNMVEADMELVQRSASNAIFSPLNGRNGSISLHR
jgi:hypothetical protein